MSSVEAADPLEDLSDRFRRFVSESFRGASPLYEHLSAAVAGDPELLRLAAYARPDQPAPNLLFGAVHLSLKRDPSHGLAAHYPSISESPTPPDDPFPLFQAFCREREEEIRAVISTRRVQTNEVGRCSCLMPAFAQVADREPGLPLSLIEIGASAGLNLNWDMYAYDYGRGVTAGDPASPVRIDCELRGAAVPPLPAAMPEVAFRVGLDLSPIDVRDPEAVLWLRALVWPEDRKRSDLLSGAVDLARRDPPRLAAGDALDRLPEALANVPEGSVTCLFHSFAVNQFSRESRDRLSTLIAEASMGRVLYRISIEPPAWPPPLELTTYADGKATTERLAICHYHGKWLEWIGGSRLTKDVR